MGLTDFLFPKTCLGCGLLGAYICRRCFRKLKRSAPPTCLYCKRASPLGLTHQNCRHYLNIDGSLSIFEYTPLLKKIIKTAKYRLAREVLRELLANIEVSLVENFLSAKKLYRKALIQPIPLSRERLFSRGFNQAEMIAEFFQSCLGLKTGNFLVRKKDVPFQAKLSLRAQRLKNIKDSFKLAPGAKVRDKTILLVDDVVTTGATVQEAARLLRAARCDKVYVLSLARQS